MGLIDWLQERIGRGKPMPLSGDIYDGVDLAFADACIREMAFWSAVNLIANAVSKCEFKTYMNGKEVKGREYYLWNVEPNKNQNSSAFLHKLIAQLYRHNECLIIEQNSELLVADHFTRKHFALYDDVFTDVSVGDFTFNRSFLQNEVLYFKLSEKNMRQVSAGLVTSYLKLIEHAMTTYKRSRGTKGVFNYETLPIAGTKEKEAFDNLLDEKFKKFMNSANAVLPLGKGQSFTEAGSKTYSNDTTRDIKAMIDDISDFTAKSFSIPPVMLRGDVQGTADALDSFLTFCIDPLADMISEEIIRKRYGYTHFAAGTYLMIDTRTIKHIDILKLAAGIDKLISSGAFCVNDIRRLVGEEPIDEEWANKHFITKNYTSIEAMLLAMAETLKGGEND